MKKGLFTGNLAYLNNKEKWINWKIVAGPPGARLSPIQRYDVVFDDKDLRIRRMLQTRYEN